MTTKYSFSDNLQRGILFLAKSNKEFYTSVSPMVLDEYFEYPAHQKFWNTINTHYEKYRNLPNDDVLIEEIKGVKSSNELLSDYKDELVRINELDVSSIGQQEYLLEKVEEFAKEEALKSAILTSVDLIKTKKFHQIQDEVRNALSVGRNVDLGIDYFDDVEDRWNSDREISKPEFRTPFATVNSSLDGGLAAKELAMVVAPPGVGKSLFLANQAVRSVLDGKNVLYISLEMSEDRVAQRIDSIFTRIKQSELATRTGDITERLKQIKSHSELGSFRIKEFPTKRAGVNALRAYLTQLQNFHEFTPDVIIIDYLELLATDGNLAEYQAQERLAQELRGLAIEHNCLVWTATQTNREGKKVKIITDAELADSYGKTRVCDLVMSINQTEEEFDTGKARLYVIKARNGRARYIVPIAIDYMRLTVGEE
jgi:replicative DNA helicase